VYTTAEAAAWSNGRSGRVKALAATAIGLMAWAGLRASEVTGLKLTDIDPVARSIRVFGKGNKVRHVGLPKRLAKTLQEWVLNHRGDFKGPLVLPNDQTGERLCRTSIRLIVTRLAKQASIKAHPHALRHYYAKALEARGFTLDQIRQMLGHESDSTTIGYLRHDVTEAVKAAAALEF
jgi:integrase/recombinase XerD